MGDLDAESSDIRERLIGAAAEVFAERGYDGAGVQEIARRAGLTTGAIYSRFRGKDDLLIEAIDASVPDEMERLLSGQVDADPVTIIAQLGSHLIDRDPDGGTPVLLEAVVAARREPELRDRLAGRLAEDRRRLVKLIDEARAAGLIDDRYSTDAVATFCNAVSFGMLVTTTLGASMPDHHDWDGLVAGLVAALAPDTSTAATQPTVDPSGGAFTETTAGHPGPFEEL